VYYVTSCGGKHERLAVLALVCGSFNWVVHTYCQMMNHSHLVVETVEGNLSAGMQQLNGIYTQRFNRRYRMSGHLFQGRYKAILLQKEAHLLELSRYVVLNLVRVQMVQLPEEWPCSRYPLMTISLSSSSHFKKRRSTRIVDYA
jgi:putative transposase